MNHSKVLKQILITVFLIFFVTPDLEAQTKKIKRPKSRVGITSVDNFVQESFDLYDKVYIYDGYAAADTPLEDEDIDVLEEALEDLSILSESAPDILSDLDGAGLLKQSKATLQINRAKKALKYSIKTAKELLLGQRKPNEEDKTSKNDNDSEQESSRNPKNENEIEKASSGVPEGLEIYSKFDFVPGDELLFFDDFSQDFIGDFPSKWNTNGSGELVKINNSSNKWLELISGSNTLYIPDITNLPEEFTLEFDILTKGLNNKTSSQSYFKILVSDNNTFSKNNNFSAVEIPLCQFIAQGIIIENNINGKREIRNTVQVDIRKQITKRNHISIAVNKQRLRFWINESKYVDIPRLLPSNVKMQSIKLHLRGLDINKESLFVSNFKIAKGGLDLRRKLLSEGRISTNGILFDSGSANIQPQSLGIVRQISQVLMQDENIKLNIIGHTDADGPDDVNLKLSKARAAAVKEALINIYKISGDRLTTDGKGETQPVGDNKTADGKAQNRRVEFIKV
jgi:outer membrane protein OmpA-like peptidoglycan-associated protein